MDLISKIRQIEQVDQLIRLKATGSPRDLARRVDLSLRHTFRLINEMKNLGFPIDYCKKRCSYYYTDPVKVHFEISVQEEKLLQVKGGQSGVKEIADLWSKKLTKKPGNIFRNVFKRHCVTIS